MTLKAGTRASWVVLLLASSAAQAQIEEIVVTARKQQEKSQDIPVAVNAIPAEQLEKLDLSSIEKIAASTPQLVVVRGTSGSGANLTLRGIGSNFTSIAIEQSVAVILDGVYYGQGRVINEAMFDLQQVEILKGPQALFFGKNATAGVLSFTSKDPGNSFETMLRTGYEFTAQEPRFEAIASGPLNDSLGLRLALTGSSQRGGYVDNLAPATTYDTFDVAAGTLTSHDLAAAQREVPGEQNLAGRLTMKYTPSEDFTDRMKLSASRYRVDNATWNSELFFCPTGEPQKAPGQECKGDWNVHHNNVPVDIAATNPLFNRHGGALYQDYDSYGLSNEAEYVTPHAVLSWVTGYHQFTNWFLGDYDDVDTTPGQVWGAERSEYDTFSTELRAQTTFSGPVNLMVGLYYDNSALDFFQEVVFPGGLEDSSVSDPTTRYLTLRKVSQTLGNTAAGFGQLSWDITPKFQFTAGARYTKETKDSAFTQPYVIVPYQSAFVQYDPEDPSTGFQTRQSFNNLSPEAMLTWRPHEDMTVYGGYKTGYKSGGFSISSLVTVNTTLGDLAFQPEEVEGWEGGVKSIWLDRRLRLNVALYSYDYTDLQIDFFDSPNLRYTTFNAGVASTRGIEVDAEWAPEFSEGLVLFASLNYNRSEYSDFPYAPCYGGQTPDEGCTIGPIPGGATRAFQDLGGKPTGISPDWTGVLRADYERTVFGKLLLGFTGNLRYSDSYETSSVATPFARQSAYSILDANVRLGADDGRWEVALLGKNLTDEHVVLGSYDSSGTGADTGLATGLHSDQTGFMGLPRTIALQMTWRHF